MKLEYKIKQSNKKFYNKWLYKVTFKLKGASVLRVYELDDIISRLEDPNRLVYGYINDAAKEKEIFVKLVDFLKNATVPYAKRIESNFLDFYTNDKEFFENLSKLLEDKIYSKYYPVENLENSEENIILAKRYPHDRYQYKVYLRPHKFKGDKDAKKHFLSWLGTQNNILISDTVKNWFIETNWNWDRRYVLVEDEKTMLLLQMRSPDAVGKIYKYRIIDK